MYKPEHVDAWKRIVDFVHGHTGARDRPPARPCRAQGLDAAACGRGSTSRFRRGTGRSSLRRRSRTSPTARCPARWTGATWTWSATSSSGPPGWPRRRGSTCSSSTWRTAICSRASSRRSRTCGRTPTGGRSSTGCATPRGVRRRAGGLAGGQADLGQDLGDRLGPRGDDRRGRRADRGDAEGARLRHRHGLDRPDGARSAARLRAALPDAVQRPDPSRGGHPDDDRREPLDLRGRQLDPGRRAGGPLRPRPRAPVRPLLDAATPRGSRATICPGPPSTCPSRATLHDRARRRADTPPRHARRAGSSSGPSSRLPRSCASRRCSTTTSPGTTRRSR